MTRLRAAIIGLGQIGSRFDEDPKREGVWTHASAYACIPEVDLVTGADPDAEARRLFSERRGIPAVYTDYRQLLAQEKPELVSICSPTPMHAEMVYAAVEANTKAIFCEKPLAHTLADGRQMVALCQQKGIVLAVNHTRHWDRNYLWPLEILRQNRIGKLQRIVAYYSARIFNMGTHLFDTLYMYTGAPARWVTGQFTSAVDDPDPTAAALLGFSSGIIGSVIPLSQPKDLIFEIDLMGTDGRLRILDNGLSLEAYQFAESPRFSHYRELQKQEWSNPLPMTDRFVVAVQDIVACLSTGGQPACGGADGLTALETAIAICRSAANNGSRQNLPLTD